MSSKKDVRLTFFSPRIEIGMQSATGVIRAEICGDYCVFENDVLSCYKEEGEELKKIGEFKNVIYWHKK